MQKKESYIEHLLHIKQALQEDRLAIFIGAGFSKAVNNEYPSWAEVIKKLKDAMPNNQATDFLQIAEHYNLEFGAIATKEKIKSYFPPKDKSSDLHKKLIELYPHYIITTNWDSILETSLEETYLVYNVIAQDKDLPKSTLNYRIIKMHGDFAHDNYVFTESDYLNYSKNFPLIETHLKGIFTTHTILFLGYGFGDIDLKFIIKWLQNSSENNRARYMLVTENNYNEYNQKYYANYGITLLPRPNDNDETSKNNTHLSKKDYEEFLEQLSQEDYEIKYNTAEEYIYNQLKPLENLKYILSSQITQALTNCNIEFIEQKIILQFSDYVQDDYDKAKKEFYKKFYSNLKEKKDNLSIQQKKIIAILQKASINGVYYRDKLFPENPFLFPKNPFLFPDNTSYPMENLNKLLSFTFEKIQKKSSENEIQYLLSNIFYYYNISKYEEAFHCCEQLIDISLKSKQYEYYFIALWNYNDILWKLKYIYIPDKELQQKNKSWENPYKIYKNKDLAKIYDRMPYFIRLLYKYIYQSLTWEWLEHNFVTANTAVTKIKAEETKINNGIFSFININPTEEYSHQNLIYYILENNILMENAKPFKDICKKYLEIGLVRKKINNKEKIELSRIEIYSIIKYFQTDELRDFLKEIIPQETTFLINENFDLLINTIFPNCLSLYTKSFLYNFSTYLCNILCLLEYYKLTQKKLKNIIENINNTITNANNINKHFAFLDTITNFYIAQYNLFTQKSDFPIKEVFNTSIILLYKFVYNQISITEYKVTISNIVYNSCSLASLCKYKFVDNYLLNLLINKTKKDTIKEQMISSYLIFLNLYPISTVKCRNIIAKYIEQTNHAILKEDLDLDMINYELLLVKNNLHKISEERLTSYFNYLEEIKKQYTFNSQVFTTLALLDEIKNKENLINSQENFKKFYDKVNSIVELYKKTL